LAFRQSALAVGHGIGCQTIGIGCQTRYWLTDTALAVRQQNKDITETDSVQKSISRPHEKAKKTLQVEKVTKAVAKQRKGNKI
jgi:hypothetical protein